MEKVKLENIHLSDVEESYVHLILGHKETERDPTRKIERNKNAKIQKRKSTVPSAYR